MRTRFILGVCVALLPVSFVCTGLAEDTNAATELHLRGLEAQWSKTAGAKDLDKMVSFYADGAMVLPPNAPSATTKEAIRKVWKDLFETPGSAVSFKPSKVEVAQSGDIAYSSGTYEVTMNDAGGKPVNDHGDTSRFGKNRPTESGSVWRTFGIPIFRRLRHPRRSRRWSVSLRVANCPEGTLEISRSPQTRDRAYCTQPCVAFRVNCTQPSTPNANWTLVGPEADLLTPYRKQLCLGTFSRPRLSR